MIGSLPMPGAMTMPPGYLGGVYAGPSSFQGNPAMGRPMYAQGPVCGSPVNYLGTPSTSKPGAGQGQTWAPSSFAGAPRSNRAVPAPRRDFASAAPQPKFRMQAADDRPAPRRLSLPAPEVLGVPPAPARALAATLDWNATRAKLDQLGALSFRVDKLGGGSHRVTLLLPTPNPQRTRHIETTAASEAAAVQLAMEQAEQK
jgi:hypothetical protein